MEIVIVPMAPEDQEGKAYVHWKSWQEAYAGLLAADYLEDQVTLERCREMARRWPDNILVAKEGGRVIGFAAYGPCRDEDLEEAGEVIALYVLADYYDRKVGWYLMNAALERLEGRNPVAVWVLEGNGRAIRFYERCGFRFDGAERMLTLGTPVKELRMLLNR